MINVAIVTIKAKTPFKIGSSKIDYIVDMPINRDFNGLPFIQGTTIAGLLRKEFDKETAKELFGYEEEKNEEGEASKVKISNALLVDEEGKTHEELLLKKSDFLKLFDELPIREHTAINHRGVAKEHSKFNEEVIYRGAKFRFMIEFEGNENEFKKILSKLKSPLFRIGGKTTSGYGEFEIEEILMKSMEIEEYVNFEPSLNASLPKFEEVFEEERDYYHFRLKLKPESFYLFGSGYSDEDADITPLLEEFVDYEHKKLSKKTVVIPASSVKGAISHRVAFYWNLEKGNFAEDIEEFKEKEENEAVIGLFGEKKDENKGKKGNVYISEVYLEDFYEKVLDHVKIDRFSGGAIDSALFQEKVIGSDGFEIDVFVKKEVDEKYLKVLKRTFDDLANGLLPLGFGGTKGHGIFTGTWEEINDSE